MTRVASITNCVDAPADRGDPGYTQFYLSMEDSLMRISGSDRAKGMMDRLGYCGGSTDRSKK